MDKTFVFTLQIDAPRDIRADDLKLAVHRTIEYAKEYGPIEGAETLDMNIGQVTIL